MSIDENTLLAKQVADWTKERDRLNDLILAAGGNGQPDELSAEHVAKLVYGSMRWAARHAEMKRETPEWQEHGNSFAQDEARRCARWILQQRIEQANLCTKESERERGDYWKGQAFAHTETIHQLHAKVDEMTILHMHDKCVATVRESSELTKQIAAEFRGFMDSADMPFMSVPRARMRQLLNEIEVQKP